MIKDFITVSGKDMYNVLIMVFMSISALIAEIMGGAQSLITVLVLAFVIDFATGWISAIGDEGLSSSRCFAGIKKKVATILLITAIAAADMYVLGNTQMIRNAVFSFFIATEMLSIVENVGECGVDMPPQLKTLFEKLKEASSDKLGNGDEKDGGKN